jgi:hypothetical protein
MQKRGAPTARLYREAQEAEPTAYATAHWRCIVSSIFEDFIDAHVEVVEEAIDTHVEVAEEALETLLGEGEDEEE